MSFYCASQGSLAVIRVQKHKDSSNEHSISEVRDIMVDLSIH